MELAIAADDAARAEASSGPRRVLVHDKNYEPHLARGARKRLGRIPRAPGDDPKARRPRKPTGWTDAQQATAEAYRADPRRFRVKAIDPGMTAAITGVSDEDGPGNHQTFSMSTREYYERAGVNAARIWREGQLVQRPDVRDAQAGIPDRHHACLAALRTLVNYTTRRMPLLLAYYRERGHRKKRWQVDCQKQRAVQVMLKRVLGEDERPKRKPSKEERRDRQRREHHGPARAPPPMHIVGLGNASLPNNTPIKRHGRAPFKKFKEALELRWVAQWQ